MNIKQELEARKTIGSYIEYMAKKHNVQPYEIELSQNIEGFICVWRYTDNKPSEKAKFTILESKKWI